MKEDTSSLKQGIISNAESPERFEVEIKTGKRIYICLSYMYYI
jgi:hypothetical protein